MWAAFAYNDDKRVWGHWVQADNEADAEGTEELAAAKEVLAAAAVVVDA